MRNKSDIIELDCPNCHNKFADFNPISMKYCPNCGYYVGYDEDKKIIENTSMTVKEYCKLCLAQSDKYKNKWEKIKGFEHTAAVFEGMAEAYADLLDRINSGELT